VDGRRVALFACAYNEIDGVANTMRHFEAFAKRHNLPLLSVHGGYRQSRVGTVAPAREKRAVQLASAIAQKIFGAYCTARQWFGTLDRTQEPRNRLGGIPD
jgi:hypothetical protein